MPYEALPSAPASGMPEDMFTYRHTEEADESLIVATLMDGSQLAFGAQHSRLPWPLQYRPYVIEHPDAVAWLEQRRERTLEARPDLRDLYENVYIRGLGNYPTLEVRHLETGSRPTLVHKLKLSDSHNEEKYEIDPFNFGSVVVSFELVESSEEVEM